MSSLPARFTFSPQSTTSIRDAIASCKRTTSLPLDTFSHCSLDRRARLFLVDTVASSADEADSDDDPAIDEENAIETPTPEMSYNMVFGDLEWDEDLTPSPLTPGTVREFIVNPLTPTVIQFASVGPTTDPHASHERTPLLRKTTSLSSLERLSPPRSYVARTPPLKKPKRRPSTIRITKRAPKSSATNSISVGRENTARPPKYPSSGTSTFGQTVGTI